MRYLITLLLFLAFNCPAATLDTKSQTCVRTSNLSKTASSSDVNLRIISILEAGLDQRLFTVDRLIAFYRRERLAPNAPGDESLKALYAGAHPLLIQVQIKSLRSLYDLVQDQKTLRLEIANLIKITEIKFNSQHDLIVKNKFTFTPIKFTQPLQTSEPLIISQFPITIGIWRDVMGALPDFVREEDENTPITNIGYPALYVFLNRLSKRYGLEPAYNPEFLNQSISVSTGSEFRRPETDDELLVYAAKGKVEWTVHRPDLLKVIVNPSAGFRLPKLMEIRAIYNKIQLAYERIIGPTWDGNWNEKLRPFSFFQPQQVPVPVDKRTILEKRLIELEQGIFTVDFLSFCPLLSQDDGTDQPMKRISSGISDRNSYFFQLKDSAENAFLDIQLAAGKTGFIAVRNPKL